MRETDLESLHTALKVFIGDEIRKVQHFVKARPPKKVLSILVSRPKRCNQDSLAVKPLGRVGEWVWLRRLVIPC